MNKAVPYRPDIDGLRCIAVTAVVLFHSVEALAPSGYVGVDIFFVISGYLIGGIIYREAGEGSFSFGAFYARRARRILPALFLVVGATLLLGMALLSTREMMMLGGSAIWALLGISNIFFWRHIDYFSPTADQNPLLMTWSLGVEEQFYLFFPPLMLLLLSRSRKLVLPSLLLVCAVSLAVSIAQSQLYPLAGYYLLPSRVWELGAGCALAVFHADRAGRALPLATSAPLALAGLGGLIASAYLFDRDTPFPGFAALLPVTATLLLLHTRGSSVNRKVLGHGVPVAIGLASYSWYLWHWPLLAFVRISSNGTASPAAMCVTALLALGIAFLSWRFVETPFRQARSPSSKVLAGYGAALASAILLIQSARAADMLPARLPPMADRIDAEIRGDDACLTPFGTIEPLPDPRCRPAGAGMALIGDSHAAAAAPGLRRHLERQGLELAQFLKPSCSPLKGYGRVSPLHAGADGECIAFNDAVLAQLAANDRIRTVILAGFWPEMDDPRVRRADGAATVADSGRAALSIGLARYVDALRDHGKQVVLMQDVPLFKEDPAHFLLSREIPMRSWLGRIAAGGAADRHPEIEDYLATREQVAAIAGARPGVTLVDTFAQLCDSDRCRIAEGGLPIFRDKQHLSLVGSAAVDWSGLSRAPETPTLSMR